MNRIALGLALSLLSAVLLIVSWQAFGDLWWLIFIAFVPMYVAQYRIFSRRWSAVAVAIATAGYYLALLLQGSSVMPPATIAAGTLALGAIGWVIGLFMRPFAERTGYRWFLVQYPLIWVALDLLVEDNEILGGGSWIAYRLGSAPQLIQPVSILSTPALSLLLLMINAAIALLVLKGMDRKWPQLAGAPIPGRVVLWSSIVTVAATVAWLATSLSIYNQTTRAMGPATRVAAVQPGLDNAPSGTLTFKRDLFPGRTEEERIESQIADLSRMTREGASRGAKVVVWPEEALDYDPRVTHTEWIPNLVRETGVYLAHGFTADANDLSSPNVALLWNPEGTVVAVYRKVKRVLVEGESFEPGTVYPTTDTPAGRLGIIICFDIEFPNGPARRQALAGSQIILAPSIDFQSIAHLRSASTVFRAVENRVGMVKTDLAWDSVIVAPNGKVLAKTLVATENGASALLVEDVPLGPANAPFTLYGGTPFAWLIYAAFIAMAGAMFRAWRCHRAGAAGADRM
ncbi:MAG: nitrilase-related carbon-nitrogen hydrolase [Methyloceanibacter sp.]